MTLTTFTVPKLEPVTRWTISRKGELMNMLHRGQISEEEILKFYKDLSPEELQRWRELFSESGHEGLKATRLQKGRLRPVLMAV